MKELFHYVERFACRSEMLEVGAEIGPIYRHMGHYNPERNDDFTVPATYKGLEVTMGFHFRQLRLICISTDLQALFSIDHDTWQSK